jgi:probable rRNA maturation factor
MTARVAVSFPEGGLPDALDRRTVRTLLGRAVRATLRRLDVRSGEVSVTLLEDVAIERLNQEYLRHEGPTDVISFALHDPGDPPLGDVYIGLDQAVRQAREHRVNLREELLRLAVHGTLHVMGYDHPDGVDRTQSEMWQVQEEIIRGVLDNE